MVQWDAERAERWMRDQAQRSEVYGNATEKMLELAEIRRGNRVLDVAAGAGEQTLNGGSASWIERLRVGYRHFVRHAEHLC